MTNSQDKVVEVINAGAKAPVVLICEHASHHIPERYEGLGLSHCDVLSHAVWDPGALAVSRLLSDALQAPLVAGCVSRLVYDLNRPPEVPGAMPSRSERITVPGNRDLSDEAKAERVQNVYEPFCAEVSKLLDAHVADAPLVVTIHSFTPVFEGEIREVELGILHDEDTRAADIMLDYAGSFPERVIRRNEPYGPADGVTHSLKLHAMSRGLANVMIEIRNDLIADEAGQVQLAHEIHALLVPVLTSLGQCGKGAGHA